MGYIVSDNIRIFPTSNRAAGNQSGTNWLTEHNIASIINQLVAEDGSGKKGFVITENSDLGSWDKTTNNHITFNIEGYYVDTTIGDIYSALGETENNKVYATITITEDNQNDESFNYLAGEDKPGTDQDNPDKCTLVDFAFSSGDLLLFNINAGNCTIPMDSRISIAGLDISNAIVSKDTNHDGDGKNLAVAFRLDDGELP